MQPEKTDTRQKIIEKAMEIVGRDCRMNVTVREIASEAGVNLASINYYFRSKEKLIEEVEDYFCQNLQQISVILDDLSTPLKARIEKWAKKLMHYLAEYPGVMFLWALYVISWQPGDSKISQIIREEEIKLGKLLIEIDPSLDKETIGFQVTQILAGVVGPIILDKVAEGNLDIQVENPKLRDRYIQFLIKNL